MNIDFKLTQYQKKLDYTYILGAFPTIEALENRSEHIAKVILHEDILGTEKYERVLEICKRNKVYYEVDSRLAERLRNKDNCFVIGVLKKYQNGIDHGRNHVVLVNPSNMGNIGTIIRTSLGFGIKDIVIVEPAVDYFSPKVIRASMGAIFHLNIRSYSDFKSYLEECSEERTYYPFMLDGAIDLKSVIVDDVASYSLIFGNEATGLDKEFSKIGQSVLIQHSDNIDSLNLSIAVGIALFDFTNK